MKVRDYLKDKILLMVMQAFCMLLLTAFLRATGYPLDSCWLILLVWAGIFSVWFWCEYFRRKRYFQHIENILEKADKRFLLGELMPDSYRLEDNLYRNYIRQSNKSVIEHLRKIEDEQKEYREYIESWVHEIKAPITSVALACENHKNVVTRNISRENQKIENYVEMALYYARLGQVYQDYQIQETALAEVVREVLVRNKYYFIQNKVQAEINCPHKVSTDKKWLLFILNQIVLNSVKYRKEEGAKIWIYTISDDEGISLIVRDNGVGIPKAEQKKIFEKGFTGSNGRTHERSTGIGLYLCRKLCGKLGLEIHAKSQEGSGTELMISFPVSSYLSKL